MKKFAFVFTITLSLLLAACTPFEDDILISIKRKEKKDRNDKDPKAMASFTVRIEAKGPTADGFATPFSPGIWLVQSQNSAPIFMNGEPDFGEGLEAIAEDGMPGMLVESLAGNPQVRARAAFDTPLGAMQPAPIFPGEGYEFSFEAQAGEYLNFATMFIQSNDLFVAPEAQGIALFDEDGHPISGDITHQLILWDAGTEVNEKPGEGPNQAPRQAGPNTGMDENGIVMPVDDGFTYPALDEVIRVIIEVE